MPKVSSFRSLKLFKLVNCESTIIDAFNKEMVLDGLIWGNYLQLRIFVDSSSVLLLATRSASALSLSMVMEATSCSRTTSLGSTPPSISSRNSHNMLPVNTSMPTLITNTVCEI